jgi:hypothetical protein
MKVLCWFGWHRWQWWVIGGTEGTSWESYRRTCRNCAVEHEPEVADHAHTPQCVDNFMRFGGCKAPHE